MSVTESKLKRLKAMIEGIATEWAETSRILNIKRESETKRIKDQQQQLIRMKMDQLISDEEFMTQRTLLGPRLSELEAHEQGGAAKTEAVLENLERIAAPVANLDQAWISVPVEFQRRFQQLMLPCGYVFGSVGTAQRGRILSFFRHSDPVNAVMVPQMGAGWNQLADEIEAFAAIFREASLGNQN